MSLGVMATELLQYFMCGSTASHKACITTACTMLHPALVALAKLIFVHVRYFTSSLSMLQRKEQTLHNKDYGGTVLHLP